MASIGDLFMRVLAQMDGFETDVVQKATVAGDKAGAAASKSLSQRLTSGLKMGLAVGLGALAGATALVLGAAAKGALDLTNVIADYQSQTGATAEEAKAAGKTINRVAGEERASLQLVGAVAIDVRKNMGLVGPEADKMTSAIVRFARITKQDAVGAVSAYDDIMDAWNLTAAQTIDIQNKLLVSNQRYGGSIVDNQRVLAELAPTFKAANLKIDDGIGLLNLFASSGVDSAVAVTGLQHALSKVKSPVDLQVLIAQIAAEPDDFKRAGLAADLFGAKAGPKLAAVLKPGIGGMQDFQVSTTDAADATNKAADIIDSTWSGRIQKAISGATAKLREFGLAAGPGLTASAAIASLVGPVLGPTLGKGIAAAWGKAGSSAIVLAAAKKAGSAGATAYLAALIAGDAIGSKLTPITGKLGTFMGTKLGKATSVAFAAVAVVEVIQTYNDVKAMLASQTDQIGTDIGKQLAAGTLSELRQSQGALEQGIGRLSSIGDFGVLTGDSVNVLKGHLAAVDLAIVGTMTDVDKAAALADRRTAVSVKNMADNSTDMSIAVSRSTETASEKFYRLAHAGEDSARRIKAAVAGMVSKLLADAQALITGYYDPLITKEQLLVDADAVAANKSDLAAARKQVADDKIALSKTKAGTKARREAQATLDASTRALHQAQLQYDQSREALDQSKLDLLSQGKLSAADQKKWLDDLKKQTKTATGATKTYLDGLIAKIKELQGISSAKVDIGVSVTGQFRDKFDPNGGRASGGPVRSNRAYRVNENTARSEWMVPSSGGYVLTHADAMAAMASDGSGGGDTYNIPLTVNGLPMQADTPLGVVRELSRATRLGTLPRRQKVTGFR